MNVECVVLEKKDDRIQEQQVAPFWLCSIDLFEFIRKIVEMGLQNEKWMMSC
jgi:hypothetical protein